MVKCYQKGRVVGIDQRLVQGTLGQLRSLLPDVQKINTAYIERLNATFRQRLAGLCRRTRCLLREQTTLHTGMYLVGTVYNFCTPHQSLGQKGQPTTPAMAAGLTQDIWSVSELLSYRIAPPPFPVPKRRGRRPKTQAQ